MPRLSPVEEARRALPWVLMGRFRNVVTELRDNRVVEVWTSRHAGVFIPAAAKFLYVPQPGGGEKLYEADIDAEKRWVTIRYGRGARVEGFLPFTAERRVITAATAVGDGVARARIVGDSTPSPTSIDIIARDILRLRASPIFGGHVLHALRSTGAVVEKGPVVTIKPVELREGPVEYDFTVPVNVYAVKTPDGYRFTAPSAAAAAVHLIGTGRMEPLRDPEGVEKLKEFLSRLREAGERVYPLSGAVLQSTRRASFTYIVGRVAKPPSEWVQLARASRRGALLKVYATPDGDLVARVSILPFNPPAVITLNYPPFTAAPLVAMLHEREFREAVAEAVEGKGREYGAEHWLHEYDVLADAPVYISTIRRVLAEGYPRLATLEDVMERLEGLGRIADVMRMAIAPADVKERLLVEEVGRVARGAGEARGGRRDTGEVVVL